MAPFDLLVRFAVFAAVAPCLNAQDDHHHAAGAPQRLGRVSFPSACASAVQPKFERGVALLHSFWYEEAAAAFGEVLAADSTCAFGYWGMAMSRLHPLWAPPPASDIRAGLEEAERAASFSRPGTRGRDYAVAIRTYYADADRVDHRTRMRAYEAAMAQVVRRHPKDDEARIFYALALIANGQLEAGDTGHVRQKKAGDILVPLFRRFPDHPGLAHYLIHAFDSPALAARGVAAAERYAQIAPSVPHALHMPSHVYVRVGRWEDVIASNLRSASAAQTFEKSRTTPGMWDQHAHALDYLMYAYLQEGKDVAAREVVTRATGATAVFPPNSIATDYALAAIPARFALERNDWAGAESLAIRPAPEWRATEGITHFARAIGAARSGHPGRGAAERDSLAVLEHTLATSVGAQKEWTTPVRIQRQAAAAWVAWAEGDTATAMEQAAAAADLEDVTEKHPVTPGAVLPARELYGDLLLEAGQPDAARKAYQAALARQPGRPRSLFGAARAAQMAGDTAAARAYFRELDRVLAPGDLTRPEMVAIKEALAAR